jgi:hypothetical protein
MSKCKLPISFNEEIKEITFEQFALDHLVIQFIFSEDVSVSINLPIKKFKQISKHFIEQYENKFSTNVWKKLSYINNVLNSKLLEKYKDKLDWSNITREYTLSNKDIQKHIDLLDPIWVSYQKKLSLENIIYLHKKHNIDLNKFIKREQITESFICENLGYFDLTTLVYVKKLTECTLRTIINKNSFTASAICANQNISEEFAVLYSNVINADWLYRNSNISEEYFTKYCEDFNHVCNIATENYCMAAVKKDLSYYRKIAGKFKSIDDYYNLVKI